MATTPTNRHLLRQVLLEGISLFPEQSSLRLHCKIRMGEKVLSTGLQADYNVFNTLLRQLQPPQRMALSSAVSDALITGGSRWNFIEVSPLLPQPCTLRRCLIERFTPNPATPHEGSLKIKALSL